MILDPQLDSGYHGAMLYGIQWTVQYRCSYREYWYDDREFANPIMAIQYADSLAQSTGRKTRVVDPQGTVIYRN